MNRAEQDRSEATLGERRVSEPRKFLLGYLIGFVFFID